MSTKSVYLSLSTVTENRENCYLNVGGRKDCVGWIVLGHLQFRRVEVIKNFPCVLQLLQDDCRTRHWTWWCSCNIQIIPFAHSKNFCCLSIMLCSRWQYMKHFSGLVSRPTPFPYSSYCSAVLTVNTWKWKSSEKWKGLDVGGGVR